MSIVELSFSCMRTKNTLCIMYFVLSIIMEIVTNHTAHPYTHAQSHDSHHTTHPYAHIAHCIAEHSIMSVTNQLTSIRTTTTHLSVTTLLTPISLSADCIQLVYENYCSFSTCIHGSIEAVKNSATLKLSYWSTTHYKSYDRNVIIQHYYTLLYDAMHS